MPESLYPEAITPGLREIGNLGDMGGIFIHEQAQLHNHPYKAAAVTAQRAADIISLRTITYIYSSSAKARPSRGYWPPPPIEEGKSKRINGKCYIHGKFMCHLSRSFFVRYLFRQNIRETRLCMGIMATL